MPFHLEFHFIFRLNIPPFMPARTVLEGLKSEDGEKKPVKHEFSDAEVEWTPAAGGFVRQSPVVFLLPNSISFCSMFKRLPAEPNTRKGTKQQLTCCACVTQYLWRWWASVGPAVWGPWFDLHRAERLCSHTVKKSPVFILSGGKGYDPEKADYSDFEAWLQCYYVDGMKSLRDHNGRTIWFKVCFPSKKKPTKKAF